MTPDNRDPRDPLDPRDPALNSLWLQLDVKMRSKSIRQFKFAQICLNMLKFHENTPKFMKIRIILKKLQFLKKFPKNAPGLTSYL